MRSIDHLRIIRRLVEKLVAAVGEDALFVVPEGFSNHIAWNAAHLVVTQQLLHYGLSGLPLHLDEELVARYRKGTGPEDGDRDSFRAVMEFAPRAPEFLAADFEAGRFQDFQRYQTSAGVALDSIEDALAFNNFHEGLHLGVMMSQRKLVGGRRP